MRRRAFAALLAAEVVSSVGTLMAAVALPWFVLETTGSPGRMGAVLAAEALPFVLVGVASGRLAGRLGARRTLLACDALQGICAALIPALHALGALSFGVLLAIAFLGGVPWAAHHGSASALVAEIAGEGGVARATAVFQTASRATYFAGPVIGGTLVAALGAPAVLVIDAATFAVSFALVAAAAPRARVADEPGIAGGVALLRRDPVLRSLTAAQFLSQGAFMAMVAAIPVLAFEAYDRSPALAGIMFGAWGAGAMLGGVVAFRLAPGREPLALGTAAWCLQALPLWVLAASPPPALAVAALAASGLGNGVRVPPMAGLLAERIPPALRPQTMTASTAITLSGGFAALLAAGPVLERAGPAAAFAGVAAAQTAAVALLVRLQAEPPGTAMPDS